MRDFEDKVLLFFVAAVSVAALWVAAPFAGAILWAIVAGILFFPLNRRIHARIPSWPNASALTTLLIIIAIVIVPAVAIGSLLVDQAITTYNRLQRDPLDMAQALQTVWDGLPASARAALDQMGLADMAAVQERLSTFIESGLALVAQQALSVGQGAFTFVVAIGVMLYMTFFLLRDGEEMLRSIGERVPMKPRQRRELFEKFATVVRATIKGSIVVAIVQGIIGGTVFWALGIEAALLWGVVMGFLSLLPAVGTGLVWVPVAIFLFASGDYTDGAILVFCGIFVIGMVDNVLRPILVGKDTRMPDWVVLVSTLGGISVMGINGFIVGPVIAAMFIASWDIFGKARSGAL